MKSLIFDLTKILLPKRLVLRVCSINFEPPDNDLSSACHDHPLFSWSMDYLNTIYVEQTDLGVGVHNLMNNLKLLTFGITTFQWLLSMKSQRE